MRQVRWSTCVIVLCVLVASARHSWAAVVEVASASAFQSALDAAQDGDEIVLLPGVYNGRFVGVELKGVHIRSADPGNPAVIEASPFGEGFKLSSVQRITISDLIVQNASNNGFNIDDAVDMRPSTDVALRNIIVRNGGGHGIKLTGVDNFTIDRVEVRGWGTGFSGIALIGSHNGVVERSHVVGNNASAGSGIKVLGGSADVTIRANRFENANERAIQIGGFVSPETFRPQPPGNVAASSVVAEGNVVVFPGNTGSGIRSGIVFSDTADSVFRHNYVQRPSLFVARILKEMPGADFLMTQNGTIEDNIFVWRQGDVFSAVNAGPNTLADTFSFSGNHWFNSTQPSSSRLALPSPEANGVYGVAPQVDADNIMPWQFDWGAWLVNATSLEAVYPTGDAGSLLLASSAGGDFDVNRPNPLLGDWTLSSLVPTGLVMEPFSYALLVDPNVLSPISADFNLDGKVDRADVEIWQSHAGMLTGGSRITGDVSGDGDVDGDDLLQLLLQFGTTIESLSLSSSNVPEPASFLLLIGAMLLLIVPLRRRRFDSRFSRPS